MNQEHYTNKYILLKTIISIIIILGTLSWGYVLFKTYEARISRHIYFHHHRPLPMTNVNYISSWMTFDYITKIYNLPQNYLQETLDIHVARYPKITLTQYATITKKSIPSIVKSTQDAVQAYLASSTSSITTTH